MRNPNPATQRGATAIEFAMVFGLMFGLFWAIISYSLPFYMLHVMNRATAEAARVAVQADPYQQSTSAYQAQVISLATATLTTQLNALPASFRTPLQPYASGISIVTDTGINYLVVRSVYANYSTHPVVPALKLPFIGTVPNLPISLVAEARMRI